MACFVEHTLRPSHGVRFGISHHVAAPPDRFDVVSRPVASASFLRTTAIGATALLLRSRPQGRLAGRTWPLPFAAVSGRGYHAVTVSRLARSTRQFTKVRWAHDHGIIGLPPKSWNAARSGEFPFNATEHCNTALHGDGMAKYRMDIFKPGRKTNFRLCDSGGRTICKSSSGDH